MWLSFLLQDRYFLCKITTIIQYVIYNSRDILDEVPVLCLTI